jgi:hypothetical protein
MAVSWLLCGTSRDTHTSGPSSRRAPSGGEKSRESKQYGAWRGSTPKCARTSASVARLGTQTSAARRAMCRSTL